VDNRQRDEKEVQSEEGRLKKELQCAIGNEMRRKFRVKRED
jgi:hypothetical protein